jgi:hypothetical protein
MNNLKSVLNQIEDPVIKLILINLILQMILIS